MKKLLLFLSLMFFSAWSSSHEKDIYQQVSRPLNPPFLRELLFEISERVLITAGMWHNDIGDLASALVHLLEAKEFYQGLMAKKNLEELEEIVEHEEAFKKARQLFEEEKRSKTYESLSKIIAQLIEELFKDLPREIESKNFKRARIYLTELRAFKKEELEIFGLDIDKDLDNFELFLETHPEARKAKQSLNQGLSFSEIIGHGRRSQIPFYHKRLIYNLRSYLYLQGVLLIDTHLASSASFIEFSSELRHKEGQKVWKKTVKKIKLCKKNFDEK